MFRLVNTTVSVHFHKIYKNSFHPYFFICCYIQNCMFAKIFTIGHSVSLSSRWHHFPNETEQSDWSICFKNKNRGFLIDCTTWHDRLCLHCNGTRFISGVGFVVWFVLLLTRFCLCSMCEVIIPSVRIICWVFCCSFDFLTKWLLLICCHCVSAQK